MKAIREFLEKIGFHEEGSGLWTSKEFGGTFRVDFKKSHCEITTPTGWDVDVVTHRVVQCFECDDQFYVFRHSRHGARIWNLVLTHDEVQDSPVVGRLVERANRRGTTFATEFCGFIDQMVDDSERVDFCLHHWENGACIRCGINRDTWERERKSMED